MNPVVKALYISLLNNKCKLERAIFGVGLIMGSNKVYGFYSEDIYKALNIIYKYKTIKD